MKDNKLHFAKRRKNFTHSGIAVCSGKVQNYITLLFPERVTCKKCMKTKDYKKAFAEYIANRMKK